MAMIVDFCVAMLVAAILDAHSHYSLLSFDLAISVPENSMFLSIAINCEPFLFCNSTGVQCLKIVR